MKNGGRLAVLFSSARMKSANTKVMPLAQMTDGLPIISP